MTEHWKPHPYQAAGIKFLIQHACAALFWDPGRGKTTTMLAAFKLLRERGMARRMLVIAPLRAAQSVWPGEVSKWSEFAGLRVSVLHGPTRTWGDVINSDISVINPEGLVWLFSQASQHDWPWDILCIDESPRFKHVNTQRFRVLKPALSKFARRYILTGTPASNGLLDLFGQVFILDLGNALGRFITHYRMNYFNPSGYGGFAWVPKAGSESRIYEKLRPLVSRIGPDENLPPLFFNKIEVELPPHARKAYKEMEALLITELEENRVVAANAAAAAGKCRQIANGGIYGMEDNERTSYHIHDAKTDVVEELVEELQGTPALIAYEFKHDLERLQDRLGDVPWIGGGVTAKRFREIEQDWNAGRIPILLAQPQSVAHGLNLQGTHAHIIRHSQIWDLEAVDQFVQRVHRQGQKEKVIVHDIIAKDTVDEVIVKVLAKKDRTQSALLDALKEKYR